jgi:hypothetical protein
MWLLHTSTLKLQYFGEDDTPSYAALSHTWDAQELTFQHVQSGKFDHLPGYAKVKGTCDTIKQRYEWVWIDTCCIDKTSSAELSQAINSMYKWYEESSICYVYLGDFELNDPLWADSPGFGETAISSEQFERDLRNCRWFNRGWTLQELLAPSNVIFWAQNFRPFGTRYAFAEVISGITGIPINVLDGRNSPRDCNVAQRMSWASQRMTTRPEDIAYCLWGLFNVHLVPIYGEGRYKAFLRLQEEILKLEHDHSLFVWSPKHDDRNQGLLASSPRAFCRDLECISWMLTNHKDSNLDLLTDPYSLLNPVEKSPPEVITGQNGKISTQSPDIHYSISRSQTVPTIGPQGLHISLLVSENYVHAERYSLEQRIGMRTYICLDLQLRNPVLGPDFNVILLMVADAVAGYESHHISRRGLLCRETWTQDQEHYYGVTSPSSMFYRTMVSISQREPTQMPSSPVGFLFQGIPRTATVRNIWVETDTEKRLGFYISTLQDISDAYGARVSFVHKAASYNSGTSGCEVPFLISFGIHGTRQTPWAAISSGTVVEIDLDEIERPNPLSHQIIDLQSSRYKSQCYRRLPCGHWVYVTLYRVRTLRASLMNVDVRICQYPTYEDLPNDEAPERTI